jgi:hypothetical protein
VNLIRSKGRRSPDSFFEKKGKQAMIGILRDMYITIDPDGPFNGVVLVGKLHCEDGIFPVDVEWGVATKIMEAVINFHLLPFDQIRDAAVHYVDEHIGNQQRRVIGPFESVYKR